MKKTTIILLTVMLFLLCACIAGCGLFGTPDNSDNPDNDTKYDLAELDVGINSVPYEYTGQPITPTVFLYDKYYNKEVAKISPSEPHSDLTVEYSNNVKPGQATVVITAKSGSKKFSGSTQFGFEIKGISQAVYASDFASLKQYLDQGIYISVCLYADVEIPAGVHIEVPAVTTLDMGDYNLINRGELTNLGVIKINGFASAPRNLINYGKLINDSQMTHAIIMDSNAALINHGQYSGNGHVHCSATWSISYIYSDHDGEKFNTIGSSVSVIYRDDINSAHYVLNQDEYDYCAAPCEPRLAKTYQTVSGTDKVNVYGDYDVNYANNVNAGKATVTITALERSNFYGTRTFEFTINKSVAQVSDAEQLQTALADDNYCGVNVTSAQSFNLTEDISVLPNVQLDLPESVISGNVTLAPGATLKLNGKTLVYGNVTGEGSIQVENDAEVYFSSNASVSSAAIVNNGAIYANVALSNVTGDGATIQRTQLVSSDITLQDLRYNGSPQQVDIAFANQTVSDYAITYKHEADNQTIWNKSLYSERGNYQARVEFSEYDKNYFGNTVFDFAIVRGTASVSNQSSLDNAIESDNYDSYVADSLTVTSSQSFTVPQGITVTANSINNSGSLTVDGNLVVSGSIKNDNAAIITVGANGALTCDLLNNLTLQVEIVLQNGGICQVNSTAYFCDEDNAAVTGECDRYVRQDIANAVFVNVSEAKYGVNTKPTFDLSVDEQIVPNLATECVVKYQGDSHRTLDATAQIIVTASDVSQMFYGVTQYNYVVAAGEIEIGYNNQSGLSSALGSTNSDGWCDYEKVIVKDSIELSNARDVTVDLSVRKGCTLVVRAPMSWKLGERNKSKYIFGNEGAIEIRQKGKLPDPCSSKYTWSDGDITMYVEEVDDFNNANAWCIPKIVLLRNITCLDTSGITIKIEAKYNDVTIDLNGRSIGDNITLSLFYHGEHTITVSNGSVYNLRASYGTSRYGDKGKVVIDNVTYKRNYFEPGTNVEIK